MLLMQNSLIAMSYGDDSPLFGRRRHLAFWHIKDWQHSTQSATMSSSSNHPNCPAHSSHHSVIFFIVEHYRLTHLQALEIMTKDAETPDALPIFYNSEDNQFYEL